MTYKSKLRYMAKYDKERTTQFTLPLNIKTCEDILDKLDNVENVQGYIKELIRKDIEENGY